MTRRTRTAPSALTRAAAAIACNACEEVHAVPRAMREDRFVEIAHERVDMVPTRDDLLVVSSTEELDSSFPGRPRGIDPRGGARMLLHRPATCSDGRASRDARAQAAPSGGSFRDPC